MHILYFYLLHKLYLNIFSVICIFDQISFYCIRVGDSPRNTGYLEQSRWASVYTFSYRDLVHSGCTGKKRISYIYIRIKFLNNLCSLNFKIGRRKERSLKGWRWRRKEGKKEGKKINYFSKFISLTFGSKWPMLNFPDPSPNNRSLFLWSI